jgi:hypothetical protein
LHDCTPLHSTSHALVPHCTFWHEFLPMHSTMHLVVPAQTTPLRHELSVSHLTSHEYPIGHVTVPLQSAPPWQSITHVFWLTLQLVHCAGQPLLPLPLPLPLPCPSVPIGESICSVPEMTQKPSTQSRPVSQSEVFVHAKSPLLCVTEQLEASANTTPTWIARTNTSLFTANLHR